ncbi:hypothetical protein [Paenarthrobacter ureafaciens]|uniref:hypothetical protein n=1 Tax=Paenarthrobacter ureafaciens TaxID=37931 RepID=UPI0009AC411C|nr:hypothetical protein [Paenarthrobacter ureafaciens]GLU58569.1 hypothetical protein Pure01_10820 [Paenarthrobacter ureafaciens]GLU61814.1 hypothetical protein Pure02_00640 [Paenarthrobacter ureafaciens]GLU66088.1 hypothetical protein Pure03_00640 [Paenarthrobacter ureafaciens]GLU71588.1 hypothetical protein Pure04_13030 [Paenarthrobacter ureafaciens]GLU74625.1 hypothetical protein Pure05_00650 [Paenarthrobacter ureafaciens]
MAIIKDLNQGNLSEIWAAIKKLQYATSQNNMAVGRGGISVYGGGGITIENGGLNVTGSATISGTLIAEGEIEMSGTFTATGTVRLSGQTDVWGPLTVTGDTDLDGLTTINGDTTLTGQFTVSGNTTVTGDFNVDGPMKTTGTLSVEGVTTLKNDLNVTTGKVVAGAVTIDAGYFDGSVRFSNGSYIAATPNGAQFIRGSGAVTVANGQADIGVGTNSIIVNTVGTFLNGLPTTTEAANLYISEGGRVYRSTA